MTIEEKKSQLKALPGLMRKARSLQSDIDSLKKRYRVYVEVVRDEAIISEYRQALAALEADVLRTLTAAISQERRIRASVGALQDPLEQQVLQLRYINGLRWQRISDITGRQIRTLHRIHNKALTHIDFTEKGNTYDR